MAEEEKPEEKSAKSKEKGKGPFKLLLSAVFLIAGGGALALMAIPGKQKDWRLKGPYFYQLAKEPITVTVPDNSQTRYIKFEGDAEYAAYVEKYVPDREVDVFYRSFLEARFQEVASGRNLKESVIGHQRQLFAEELRVRLDPIVFPVHIGSTRNPLDLDSASGLRPGVSHLEANFRGLIHEHVLKVDGSVPSIQLDDGPRIVFRGDEDDLRIESPSGATLFVDVTHFRDSFQGEVPVGVHGKLRRIILRDAIGQ